MRNARAQGALVMHNHPGWRRTSLEMTEVEKKAHAEKLIDGIEIMNGQEFYPKAITRAAEKGLFMAACTDIHATSSSDYRERGGYFRNMTFILAKDKSLESLKEALQADRTIVYSYGTLAGSEELMKKFFLKRLSRTFPKPLMQKKKLSTIVTTFSISCSPFVQLLMKLSLSFPRQSGHSPLTAIYFSTDNKTDAVQKDCIFLLYSIYY